MSTASSSRSLLNARRRSATYGARAAFHFCQPSPSRHVLYSAESFAADVSNSSAAFACGAAFLPSVINFSTNGRSSLAFGVVVTIRPATRGASGSSGSGRTLRIRLHAIFLNIALRCEALRPSLRPRIR